MDKEKLAEAVERVRLVNEQRAAEILGLQVKTLQEWRTSGKGCPFVKIGRAVRYSLADLDAFIAENTVRSTTEADARKRAS